MGPSRLVLRDGTCLGGACRASEPLRRSRRSPAGNQCQGKPTFMGFGCYVEVAREHVCGCQRPFRDWRGRGGSDGRNVGRAGPQEEDQNRPIVMTRVDSTDLLARLSYSLRSRKVPLSLQQRRRDSPPDDPSDRGGSPWLSGRGGRGQLLQQDGTMRFSISADAAKAQDIAIDAKLLSLAKPDPR